MKRRSSSRPKKKGLGIGGRIVPSTTPPRQGASPTSAVTATPAVTVTPAPASAEADAEPEIVWLSPAAERRAKAATALSAAVDAEAAPAKKRFFRAHKESVDDGTSPMPVKEGSTIFSQISHTDPFASKSVAEPVDDDGFVPATRQGSHTDPFTAESAAEPVDDDKPVPVMNKFSSMSSQSSNRSQGSSNSAAEPVHVDRSMPATKQDPFTAESAAEPVDDDGFVPATRQGSHTDPFTAESAAEPVDDDKPVPVMMKKFSSLSSQSLNHSPGSLNSAAEPVHDDGFVPATRQGLHTDPFTAESVAEPVEAMKKCSSMSSQSSIPSQGSSNAVVPVDVPEDAALPTGDGGEEGAGAPPAEGENACTDAAGAHKTASAAAEEGLSGTTVLRSEGVPEAAAGVAALGDEVGVCDAAAARAVWEKAGDAGDMELGDALSPSSPPRAAPDLPADADAAALSALMRVNIYVDVEGGGRKGFMVDPATTYADFRRQVHAKAGALAVLCYHNAAVHADVEVDDDDAFLGFLEAGGKLVLKGLLAAPAAEVAMPAFLAAAAALPPVDVGASPATTRAPPIAAALAAPVRAASAPRGCGEDASASMEAMPVGLMRRIRRRVSRPAAAEFADPFETFDAPADRSRSGLGAAVQHIRRRVSGAPTPVLHDPFEEAPAPGADTHPPPRLDELRAAAPVPQEAATSAPPY